MYIKDNVKSWLLRLVGMFVAMFGFIIAGILSKERTAQPGNGTAMDGAERIGDEEEFEEGDDINLRRD